MIVIVLKDSTFRRVMSRLRYHAVNSDFLSLTCRIYHRDGFTYLHFRYLENMCTASDFLFACNAVYRVINTGL